MGEGTEGCRTCATGAASVQPGKPYVPGKPQRGEPAARPGMTLVTDLSHAPGPVVVALPAEIDMATAGQAGADLGSVFARNPCTVIADMTATRFCDSSGISMLVRAHKQAAANGTELRLVVRSAAVLRTMALAGVGKLLPIFPTVTQALATAPVPEPQPHRERSWTARSP